MDRLFPICFNSIRQLPFSVFHRSPVLGFAPTPDAPAKLRPPSQKPIPTNTKRGSILTPVASDRPSSRPFSRKSRNRAPPFPITKRVPLSGSKLPEHPPRRNIPPSVGGTGCASGHRPNLTALIARMRHFCLSVRGDPLFFRARMSFSTTRRQARPKRIRVLSTKKRLEILFEDLKKPWSYRSSLRLTYDSYYHGFSSCLNH